MCMSGLSCVFSIFTLQWVFPFFILFSFCSSYSIISTVQFSCWLLLSSACSDLLLDPSMAIAGLGEAGSSRSGNAYGCVPGIPMGHVLWGPFARHSHFFWAFLSRPAHCTALAQHRLPRGSSSASIRSSPSSWSGYPRLPVGWHSVEGWERRASFFPVTLIRGYQHCCVCLIAPPTVPFAVFTFADFLFSPTFSHTHIYFRHRLRFGHINFVTIVGFPASSSLSQCPFLKNSFPQNFLGLHGIEFSRRPHPAGLSDRLRQFFSSTKQADYTFPVVPSISAPWLLRIYLVFP